MRSPRYVRGMPAPASPHPPFATPPERERYASEIRRLGVVDVIDGITVKVLPSETAEGAYQVERIIRGRRVLDDAPRTSPPTDATPNEAGCGTLLNAQTRAFQVAVAARENGATPLDSEWLRLKTEAGAPVLVAVRLGDYYEFFFEDAERSSRVLGIPLTHRNGFPMAGVAVIGSDPALAKLKAEGWSVAIAEIAEKPKPDELAKRVIVQRIEPDTAELFARAQRTIASLPPDRAELLENSLPIFAEQQQQLDLLDAEGASLTEEEWRGRITFSPPNVLLRWGQAEERPLTRQEARILNDYLPTIWTREHLPGSGARINHANDWPIAQAGDRPTEAQAATLSAFWRSNRLALHRALVENAWREGAPYSESAARYYGFIPAPETEPTASSESSAPLADASTELAAGNPEPGESLGPLPEMSSIEAVDQFRQRLNAGTLNAEQVKAAWVNYKAHRLGAITAELNRWKKDRLLQLCSVSFRSSDKKEQLVSSALHSLDGIYGCNDGSGVTSFVIGYGNYEESWLRSVEERVAAWTDAKIAAYVQKLREREAEKVEETKAREKALANPETLEEFEIYVRKLGSSAPTPEDTKQWGALRKIRGYNGMQARQNWIMARGEKKLSPELLASYDALRGIKRQAELQEKREERATVEAVREIADVGMTVSKHFHEKRRADVWIVQMSEKVPEGTFKELAGKARALDGNYVRAWKPTNSPAGFQFMSEATAQKFMSLRETDVSRAEEVQANREEKTQNAVERLRDMAARMIERAEDSLSADRQTNTARRARMAAGAEGDAYARKALAETMQNLAAAIESGEATHLGGIRNRTHVELLAQLVHRAHHRAVVARNGSQREFEAPATEVEMAAAEYPWPWFDESDLMQIASLGENTNGAKLLAARVLKLIGTRPDAYIRSAQNIETVRDLITRLSGDHPDHQERRRMGYLLDKFADYTRTQQMGLVDLPSLRAALREFMVYRARQGQIDPITQAERALIGTNIPGFFPTPAKIAERMANIAGIRKGMRVLEPSGGKGDLADAARARGAIVDVIELQYSLRELLALKGFNVVAHDFLSFEAADPYDVIMMNPPFENGQDIEHLRHAFTMLKPGGKLVAITSEGPFFREDKASLEFRAWLEEREGESERLDAGSFAGSDAFRQTGVNARIVTLTNQAIHETPKAKTANALIDAQQLAETSLLASNEDPAATQRPLVEAQPAEQGAEATRTSTEPRLISPEELLALQPVVAVSETVARMDAEEIAFAARKLVEAAEREVTALAAKRLPVPTELAKRAEVTDLQGYSHDGERYVPDVAGEERPDTRKSDDINIGTLRRHIANLEYRMSGDRRRGATLPDDRMRLAELKAQLEQAEGSSSGGAKPSVNRENAPALLSPMGCKLLFADIDSLVFKDHVTQGIQRDGQLLLTAVQDGDANTVAVLAARYQNDAIRAQGGGGAGPGRVKGPRAGASTIGNAADMIMRRLPLGFVREGDKHVYREESIPANVVPMPLEAPVDSAAPAAEILAPAAAVMVAEEKARGFLLLRERTLQDIDDWQTGRRASPGQPKDGEGYQHAMTEAVARLATELSAIDADALKAGFVRGEGGFAFRPDEVTALMTPEQFRQMQDERWGEKLVYPNLTADASAALHARRIPKMHRETIVEAIEHGRPVCAAAAECYGVVLPEGYSRQADRFAPLPGTGVTIPSVAFQAPVIGESATYNRWIEQGRTLPDVHPLSARPRRLWANVALGVTTPQEMSHAELEEAGAVGRTLPARASTKGCLRSISEALTALAQRERETIEAETATTVDSVEVMPRKDLIERIVEAIRERENREPIVVHPSVELKATNGKWYNPGGFPWGVSSTGEKRVVGYALYMSNGTTVGRRELTEQAVRDRVQRARDNNVSEARAAFLKEGNERLIIAADYWLGGAGSRVVEDDKPTQVTPEQAVAFENTCPGTLTYGMTERASKRAGALMGLEDAAKGLEGTRDIPARQYAQAVHQALIEEAVESGEPVNPEACETYGIALPPVTAAKGICAFSGGNGSARRNIARGSSFNRRRASLVPWLAQPRRAGGEEKAQRRSVSDGYTAINCNKTSP